MISLPAQLPRSLLHPVSSTQFPYLALKLSRASDFPMATCLTSMVFTSSCVKHSISRPGLETFTSIRFPYGYLPNFYGLYFSLCQAPDFPTCPTSMVFTSACVKHPISLPAQLLHGLYFSLCQAPDFPTCPTSTWSLLQPVSSSRFPYLPNFYMVFTSACVKHPISLPAQLLHGLYFSLCQAPDFPTCPTSTWSLLQPVSSSRFPYLPNFYMVFTSACVKHPISLPAQLLHGLYFSLCQAPDFPTCPTSTWSLLQPVSSSRFPYLPNFYMVFTSACVKLPISLPAQLLHGLYFSLFFQHHIPGMLTRLASWIRCSQTTLLASLGSSPPTSQSV